MNERFITLDIETRVIKNEEVPYLIAWFYGKVSKSLFLTYYLNSPDEMIKNCILSLCRFKYHNSRIYMHNLAKFDGIFLLRILAQLGKIKS